MNVKSLGYRTDLIFPTFDGEVIDRGDYLVIHTPTNPTFYWGNFLLFQQAPIEGDLKRWRDLFALEIGTPPECEHQVFGWDSPEGDTGDIQPFMDAGFRLTHAVVLTSGESKRPSKPSSLVSTRSIETEADWDQVIDNQVICRETEFEETEYRDYKLQQKPRYQKMTAANLGNWYGAFIEDQLVADLGLFHGNGLGRFQSVETHPNFRRRGIAGTLIYEAGRLAMAEYKLHTLVIVADQDSNAERLYKSLGYQQTEKQVGMEWWPQMTRVEEGEES